jgi:hypothetical protein
MADVSVEFGATDSGLAQTLKNVQEELAALDTQQKTASMSADEFQKSLSRTKQLEGLETKIQKMAASTTEAGKASADTAPKVDKLGREMTDMGDKGDKAGTKVSLGFGNMLQAGAAFATGMAAVNAAFAAIKGTMDEFGAALDLGGRLDDLSIQTGIAAGELLVLERAFQNSGAGADKVSTTISKVASAIVDATSGSGAASASFDRLGLSASELINLPADKQFEKISSALSGVANQTERSALANDIFGQKLAKDLLPLISDFGGEINKAGGQLGSLPGIMNGAAKSFADIGDNIKVAQGKLTEFAAGLLSVMTPAIDAVVTALTRINAAQIGKDLGSAFVGAGEAMKGFQSAVDAFQAGNISLALKLIFESVKLQAMETGNSIVNIFSAAFQTAGDVLGEIFSAQGPTFMLLRSSFDFVAGYAKDKIATAMSDMFSGMGPAFASISKGLKQQAEAGATAAELALLRIPVSAELAAEDIANILGTSTERFQNNLAAANIEFFDTKEAAAAVAEVTAQIAENTKEAVDSSGELIQNLGFNANEAARLSFNLTAAKGAIADSGVPAVALKTKLSETTEEANFVFEAIKKINEEKMDQSAEGLKKSLADSREKLGEMKDFIGEDLSNAHLNDVIKKLGLDASKLETDKAKINAIEEAVKAIGNADVADITPKFDEISLNPKLDAVQNFVKNLPAPDVTPTIGNIDGEVSGINTSLANVSQPDSTPRIDTEQLSANITAANQMLGGMNDSPITISLDAADSINTIRTELAKPIQMDLQGDAGGGILADIKTLVDAIKIAVEKIEPKLPQQALAY